MMNNYVAQKISDFCEIRRIVKTVRYDCVHIHSDRAPTAYLCFLASRKYVNKVIFHAHNAQVKDNTIKLTLHKLLKKRLHGTQTIAMACSDDAAKWLFPKTVIQKKQYIVLNNGIYTERFTFNSEVRDSVRTRLKIRSCFVIGHVGRFAYQKNHEFLIDVFVEIKKRLSNAVLLLIGGASGEDRVDETKKKVASLGLAKSVIFYGNTDRVNELYQAMDCFVFPSRYEGLGIAAIEAQAAGLKTLCSDRVPQEAKITDLCEYMVLSDGPEKWAEKILTYVNGYERKDMSEEIVAAGYDIKASAKQLENIYLSCCVKADK